LAVVLAGLLQVGPALAAPVTTHSTDFTGFGLGSVNGQGGWSVSNPSFDQAVVDVSGNRVLRLSNQFGSGSFGDQPFAPRPGGTGMTAGDPTNSQPQFFAGESSTGATYNRFIGSFDFRSVATDASDTGARITVSPDNGQGGRQSFAALENVAAGVRLSTFDINPLTGAFIGPQTIGTVGFGQWANLSFEIDFNNGPSNDIARILLNGLLVSTINSWENFYSITQPLLHPNGVPVQTLLYRISGTSLLGAQGFYIDNVRVALGNQVAVAEPATLALFGAALAFLGVVRRRRRQA